jgi:hypothetical protein
MLENAMNMLPTTSVATRLNAFVAAAVVTLAVLAAIDNLASRQAASPQMANAASTHEA